MIVTLIERDDDGSAAVQILRYNPDQERDDHGRFGSGDGGSSSGGKSGRTPTGAAGVRPALAAAKNATQVSKVLSQELEKTMGRPVDVNMQGMNTQVARETAEGVLRGAEQFPQNELSQVTTFGDKGAVPNSEIGPYADRTYAITKPGPDGSNTDRIIFNADMRPSTYRDRLAKSGDSGKTVGRDPTGTAIHEFGHVVSAHNSSVTDAGNLADASANKAGEDFFDHVSSQVSSYASNSEYELTAEGFADVVQNGSGASQLSQDIYAAIEKANS